jgi:hypothetical protein
VKLALAVCAASLALAASRASAAAPLAWTAPAPCPDAARLRAALARSAGDELAGDDVRIVVEPRGELWHARVHMPTGERELTGESCQALADAVIVILSLANEQRAAVAVPPEPVVAPAAAPAARVREPDRSPPVVAASLYAAPRGVQLGMALLGEVGLLPGPSAGPRLSLGVSDGRWALELSATLLVPRAASLAGEAAPSADIRWLGAQLLVCRASRALLRLCGGGEVGELTGEGQGVERPETAHGAWVAFVGAAALRGPLGALPVSWEAGVAAASALLRPEFGFDEVGILHRAGQISGRAWLGLGWN